MYNNPVLGENKTFFTWLVCSSWLRPDLICHFHSLLSDPNKQEQEPEHDRTITNVLKKVLDLHQNIVNYLIDLFIQVQGSI